MNIVLYAGEAKGVSSLLPIYREAERRKINFWALFSTETQIQFPNKNKDKFNIISNVGSKDSHWSETLGLYLPFRPDCLLIQRERWEPELSILQEFKYLFNCKIGVVEQNAAVFSNIETFLETINKNAYMRLDKTNPLIDFFFDHSSWTAETRRLDNFKGKLIVSGNPKYDINLDFGKSQIGKLREKYSVPQGTPATLVASTMSDKRYDFFNEVRRLKNISTELFFIKPYPGEPYLAHFKQDYDPEFIIDGVTPIFDESDIWGMFHICDHHIGTRGSIVYPTLLLKKKYTDLSFIIGGDSHWYDFSPYLEKGASSSFEFRGEIWTNTIGLNDISEIQTLIPESVIKKAEERNHHYISTFKDYVSDSSDLNHKKMLKFFDDFNDCRASERILDFLESEL